MGVSVDEEETVMAQICAHKQGEVPAGVHTKGMMRSWKRQEKIRRGATFK